MRKSVLFGALLALLPSAPAPAQNAPVAGEVQVTFIPPPMEGTLSLGVYNAQGKLVRVLRTEGSPEKDFTPGLNGLIAKWDGKDDAGKPLPPGSYAVRGYAVGPLEVSGEAFLGNDWIADEQSARVAEILSLKALAAGGVQIRARLVDDTKAALQADAEGHVTKAPDGDPSTPESGGGVEEIVKGPAGPWPDLVKPLDAAFGMNDSVWIIDETSAGTEVKQYSPKKELLRHLTIAPDAPAPRQIAASRTDERLYLLESKPGLQRVRGLSLENTTPGEGAAQSTWKEFFSKSIVHAPDFASAAPWLARPEFKPEAKVHVHLIPNPLFKDAPGNVDLQVATDAEGSFLRAGDGLPLDRLTETPHLKWVVLGHDGRSKSLTLFQSDGAVVEEYRIKQPANMMAFDAGEYELKR